LAESGFCERHAERAAREMRLGEFGLDVGLLRATHAGAGRVARLGHEAVDHAVKDDAVIETFAGQLLDLRDMLRRQVRAKLDHDATILQIEIDRVLRVELLARCLGRRGNEEERSGDRREQAKETGH